MKHLKIFNSTAEFEAAKPSMEIPYVVLDEETGEVVYCNIPSITEDEITGGPYVDLGLSVKWASCNVGATKPCESGLLFQFGRTDGYLYNSTDHRFTVGGATPTTTSGRVYAAGETLDLADDAAHANMRGNWRMPTETELTELNTLPNEWCTCTFLGEDHEYHSIVGRKFTGNGNTIFIPAAGFFLGSSGSFFSSGSDGYVWSSSVRSGNVDRAYGLYFDSGFCSLYSGNRYCGFSVRGVKD